MDRAPQGRSRWATALTAALTVATAGAVEFAEAPTLMRVGFLIAAALTAGAAVLPGTDSFEKNRRRSGDTDRFKKRLEKSLVIQVQ